MSPVTRPTRPHPWAVAAWVIAACSSPAEPAPQTSQAISTPGCPMLTSVVQRFGATMRGAHSPFVLGAYFAVEGGKTVIRSPEKHPCGERIAARLIDHCEDAYGSKWCYTASTTTFEACVAAVEAVLSDPSLCASCGDGYCAPDEQKSTWVEAIQAMVPVCPQDCACGNGACEPNYGENVYTCEEDCPSACGDGLCTGMERCSPCEDLPYDLPGCVHCPADCCTTACGDGACHPDAGETRDNCEQDCALGVCGDGVCLGGETALNCSVDCWDTRRDDHCLDPACVQGACRDPRQLCGDGVCMGCEAWTCAMDCQHVDFTICLEGPAHCPPGSCGDGVCDRPSETGITCPLDCASILGPQCVGDGGGGGCSETTMLACPERCAAGDPDQFACGDGYCSPAEAAVPSPGRFTCPEDCLPRAAGACAASPVCAASGRRCAVAQVAGPVSGLVTPRHVVARCDGPCEVLEVCPDVCVQDGADARCEDCSWTHGEASLDCLLDPAPRCHSGLLWLCEDDPGRPGVAACRVRRPYNCQAGCDAGACLPCNEGASCTAGTCNPDTGVCEHEGDPCAGGACAVCGNGKCEKGETLASCPADCACRAECYFAGYDQDEHECPEAFAACRCGNGTCDPWEKSGPWRCAEDCP